VMQSWHCLVHCEAQRMAREWAVVRYNSYKLCGVFPQGNLKLQSFGM